jgi:neopullulanase
MKLSRRLLAIGVLFFACGASSSLQAQSDCALPQSAHVPCITKIDPPDWWVGLPDPMLLVNGRNLDGAQFAVESTDVRLIRTQTSENGHWAFLWIDSSHAAAQTLWITATALGGKARAPFQLAKRSQEPHAHGGFSSVDVLYLVMTDRFADGNPTNDQPGYNRSAPRGWHGGDLNGITQHLDYLHDLGVTAVWTTPVVSNGAMPQSYHGYAATDLYAVDPHLGTLSDYRHLSDELHARGMKLVIDLVPNHIGLQHPWVLDPPAPEWLHGTLQNHILTKGNFESIVDPHATRQAWNAVTNGWFTDAMPDLNQENPLVSEYLIDNALWWIEKANLDGIRLDTFPYVGRAFWHDFHAAIHGVYPHMTSVGEVFNGNAEITSFFAGGIEHRSIDTGLYTPFDFPVHFALLDVLAHGKPMTDLQKVLGQDALYPHPERLVPFLGNHDTVRFLTEAHDSVPVLKLGLGLLATLRGMPQIYSGDEIAMTGRGDPDNRHDFPGGFPGDPRSAFTATGRTPTEQEVFSWTVGLLALRNTHPALQTGIEQNLFSDETAFAFVRTPSESRCSSDHTPDTSNDRFLIVVNKGTAAKTLDLPMEMTALAGCTEFKAVSSTVRATSVLNGNSLHIEEPAQSLTVFEVR